MSTLTRVQRQGPFKDTATVKIVNVEDADEPPVFSSPTYLLEVHENAALNSVIGQVTARDPDITQSDKVFLFRRKIRLRPETSRSVQNVIMYAVHVAAFETLLTWPRDFSQHAPCLWPMGVLHTHMPTHLGTAIYNAQSQKC